MLIRSVSLNVSNLYCCVSVILIGALAAFGDPIASVSACSPSTLGRSGEDGQSGSTKAIGSTVESLDEEPIIHRLAACGDADRISLQLQAGTPVDCRDQKGNTPLHIAAKNGRGKVAEILLKNGADPNNRDRNGSTPLHLASDAGDSGMVETLLRYGSNVNSREALDKETPLHFACREGHLPIVKLLLQYGAKVNRTALGNVPPLYEAIDAGKAQIVEFLLEKGHADPKMKDRDGAAAVHYAASRCDPVILQLVLGHVQDVNVRNKWGDTPLHYVAGNGGELHEEDIRAFNAAGSLGGETVVDEDHMARRRRENMDCARLLIAAGADVNARNRDQRTPLHEAVLAINRGCVQLLIQAGAKEDVRDRDGESPLSIAVRYEGERGATGLTELLAGS